MKKIFLVIFITFVSFSSITYAISKFNYESALQVANDYIINSSFDENWKNHSPHIEGKGREFHTIDDNKISYIEFKVSCDNKFDCGFIMVNYDGDDIIIPIASTSGNTPSEVLLAENKGNIVDNKLYYFSPFSMYADDIKTNSVSSINPPDNIITPQKKTLTEEEKKIKKQELNNLLRDKINFSKEEARVYKKTDDFKNKINDLRDAKQAILKEEVSYKILPFVEYANATIPGVGGTGYIPPSNASNTFVSGSTYSGCNGKMPCYKQILNVNYNGSTCAVGCVPTAYTILFGYYDRKGTFPNLITGTASTIGSTVEDNVMIDLGKNYMSTICSGAEGLTSANNGMIGGVNYAKSKGYLNTIGNAFTTNIFYNLKTEINAGRPVILGNGNHAIVGYGYYNTTDTTKQIIRVNLGYGALYNVTNSGGTVYYGSNIDYNINSLYYNSSTQPGINSLIKIIIS